MQNMKGYDGVFKSPPTMLPSYIPRRVALQVTLTEPSFEDLALRFMDAAQPGALQRFLQASVDADGVQGSDLRQPWGPSLGVLEHVPA